MGKMLAWRDGRRKPKKSRKQLKNFSDVNCLVIVATTTRAMLKMILATCLGAEIEDERFSMWTLTNRVKG